jgi:hypothetical protein
MNIPSLNSVPNMQASAMQGIQRGVGTVSQAATEIARSVAQPQEAESATDFTRSVVDMRQGELQAKASGRAMQAYGDTIGTLLDVQA